MNEDETKIFSRRTDMKKQFFVALFFLCGCTDYGAGPPPQTTYFPQTYNPSHITLQSPVNNPSGFSAPDYKSRYEVSLEQERQAVQAPSPSVVFHPQPPMTKPDPWQIPQPRDIRNPYGGSINANSSASHGMTCGGRPC